MHGGVLIYKRGQVHGEHLIQNDGVIGQTAAHELRNQLIHADYLFAQLLGLFAARVQVHVGAENDIELAGNDIGKVVEVIPCALETGAAHTLADAVEERGNGQVGVHPAVAQNGLDILNGVAERPFYELAPKHAPLTVVKGGVLESTPLTVLVDAGFRLHIICHALCHFALPPS